MSSRSEIALEKFSAGYNCAQSVFYSFCEDLGLDKNTALRIASGLGSGMGRSGEVCGAVSGGILVLGTKYGRGENDSPAAKELTYTKTRALMSRFSGVHGSYKCRDLLNGYDLTTEEGFRQFKVQDLTNKVCKHCVRSMVEILQEML